MDERAIMLDLIARLLPWANARDADDFTPQELVDWSQTITDARELLAREDRDSAPSGVTFQRIDAQGRVQDVPVESVLGEKK
jgi:hypothetical protein